MRPSCNEVLFKRAELNEVGAYGERLSTGLGEKGDRNEGWGQDVVESNLVGQENRREQWKD